MTDVSTSENCSTDLAAALLARLADPSFGDGPGKTEVPPYVSLRDLHFIATVDGRSPWGLASEVLGTGATEETVHRAGVLIRDFAEGWGDKRAELSRKRAARICKAASPWIGDEWAERLAAEILDIGHSGAPVADYVVRLPEDAGVPIAPPPGGWRPAGSDAPPQ